MLFLNKRYYQCVLEAVLLLLLSLFSGTTALFPNGASCQFASECESGACCQIAACLSTCVDKIALGEICTVEAPCANPENTTCNFFNFFGAGVCEIGKKTGEECSNFLPQSRCVEQEPQLGCKERLFVPPKCLILKFNGDRIPTDVPDPTIFFCEARQRVVFAGGATFCSEGNPGDICRRDDQCLGEACSGNKCVCDGQDRCVTKGLDGEDCFEPGLPCAEGLKCLFIRSKCTAGVVGSPCTLNIDCGKVIGSVLECSGGFCAKRGGIGQPCTGGAAGLTQGTCASGLRCSGRRGTCGCRPVIGCP